MLIRVLIVFVSARMFAETTILHAVPDEAMEYSKSLVWTDDGREVRNQSPNIVVHLQKRDEALRIERARAAILTNSYGSIPGTNQQDGRILTTSKDEAPTKDSDEKQRTVTCDRWYMSIDGKMQCLLMKSTSESSNEIEAPQNPKQPMHVYLPGLPSFGIPIWSSSPLDSPPRPLLYGSLHPRGEENDRKPAHGHEETLELKPGILEPVQIIPKPIVVHKPVLVPKPIAITVHKPVLVLKPIEIHEPAIIHKPVEIPIHKPVFVHKPILIPVHKPVLIHKPIEIKPVEHNYESLLSQILKQHITNSYLPQHKPQDVQGGATPHTHTQENENPGLGGLHQTGFVSAHDVGKDTAIQGYGLRPSEDNIYQKRFPVTPHDRPDAPSPVEESHIGIGATTGDTSSGDRADFHSDSDVQLQTDQVVEDVIKTIQQTNEELPKSIFSEGDVEDSGRSGTFLGSQPSGSPKELLRNNLNSTIPTNMELEGSRTPLNEFYGAEIAHLDENEASSASSEIFKYGGTHPTLPPTNDAYQMASDTKSIESEMAAETMLEEGPDVIEDAQKQQEDELNRTIREARGILFDDILRDKQQAGWKSSSTELEENGQIKKGSA